MCVAHVNMQQYWSCHFEIGLLWLLMLREKMDGATETYVIGVTVAIHLAKCVLHALCMCLLACLHVHIPGFLSVDQIIFVICQEMSGTRNRH